MTRKDYIALAAALKGAHPGLSGEIDKNEAWRRSVRAVADTLAADNPRFDMGRFLNAATPAGRVS